MQFDNTYDKLPKEFYSESTPQSFANPQLLAINFSLANELGLELDNYSSDQLARLFSGQEIFPGSHIISTVYSAHQFGHFSGRLGDGRAMLLGEVIANNGKRYDVQLKGSGPTAYSRNGDGLSALGPVIREYLVSEAMHHLGVPTTRALAAVVTGEPVYRQTITPGGVFTRVAASHIRIGTFQYFASKGDTENLKVLLDYAIKRHYPEISENHPLNFLEKVIHQQTKLVAKWLSIGFIHGVMNTDNTSISGETIDFGPCAFMDTFQADKVYSSIDSYGRYAYDQQKNICAWNLCRLADCLIPLVDEDPSSAIEKLNQKLGEIFEIFEEYYYAEMIKKFALTPSLLNKKNDLEIIEKFLSYLEDSKLDFTLSFRNLSQLFTEGKNSYYPVNNELNEIIKYLQKRWQQENISESEFEFKINSVNPVFIPRNHLVEKTIQECLKGDLRTFNRLNNILKNPFHSSTENGDFALPPKPCEEVKATFCGT